MKMKILPLTMRERKQLVKAQDRQAVLQEMKTSANVIELD